jgi:hypothetical protein
MRHTTRAIKPLASPETSRPRTSARGYATPVALPVQASSRQAMFRPWPPLFCLLAVAIFACSEPATPPDPEPAKPTLSLVVRTELTGVDLVLNSPITLATLQAVVTFDPIQIQASDAIQGVDGLRVSLVFDDAARVPGKLLVGLADINQNPLPRSGAIARVALTNATSGDVLGLEGVVAVDIFGNKVAVEVNGTTVP